MSLQVWLPLTKDTRNQGLTNIVFSLNLTLESNGKLGQYCAKDGGVIHLTNDFLSNSWSLACWVKSSNWSVNNDIILCKNAEGSTNCQFYLSIINGASFNLGINGGSSNGAGTYSYTFSTNTWYHVAATYDGTNYAMYINGNKVKSGTYTSSKPTNLLNLGVGCRSTNAAGTGVTGNSYKRLNDVRIYDHALSPMEVKLISQGLILHYPLNRQGWGQENLLSGNNAKITTWTNYMPNSVILSGDGYDNKYTLIKGIGGWEKIFTDAITVTNGNTYTLSFDYSVEQNYTGYSGQFGLSVCTTSQTKYGADTDVITKVNFGTVQKSKSRTSVTFTATSNTIYLVANGGNINDGQENISFYISYIKLEEGSIATPWCPNSSDAFATTMDLNSTTEYDCSGFCNNGKYYAYDSNGSITYTSDTPKYCVSTHIASVNSTSDAASGTRYLYGHCSLVNPTQMTVAFWLKPVNYGYRNSTGQGYFCTTTYEYGNISVGADYQGSAMNHRDDAVDINDSTSATQCRPSFTPTLGEWHHYTITYDGQVGKVYKDGVQSSTAQFGTTKTLDSFVGVVIGFSKAGGVWRRNDAYYSDFRIYATALSADDVKSLYQNSAYIDSSGNVYGAVHSEV